METLELDLDRSSPTPLYHQIVQSIRWRIGTGMLAAGDTLPPIREAAQRWDVNYHTVRRAYHGLAAQGWVKSLQGSGTQVAMAPPIESAPGVGGIHGWLDRVLAEGQQRYGLSAERLAALIGERSRTIRVVIVECNRHQSDFLAEQIEHAWGAEAIAWSLEERGQPPELPIIGTYFHYSEIRRRWPDRIPDMHFVALRLDPALGERVARVGARRGARVLRLVEQDPATAREMAAGVAALVAGRFEVRPEAGDPEAVLRSLAGDELLLIAPRLWDSLGAATRQDERVFDVRHVIAAEDLNRLRSTLAALAAPTHA